MSDVEHDAVVGTRNGYEWHRRRNEPACDPCLKGHRVATQRWRDENWPDRARVSLSLLTLADLLDLVPPRLGDRVIDVLGDETLDRVKTVRARLRPPQPVD